MNKQKATVDDFIEKIYYADGGVLDQIAAPRISKCWNGWGQYHNIRFLVTKLTDDDDETIFSYQIEGDKVKGPFYGIGIEDLFTDIAKEIIRKLEQEVK